MLHWPNVALCNIYNHPVFDAEYVIVIVVWLVGHLLCRCTYFVSRKCQLSICVCFLLACVMQLGKLCVTTVITMVGAEC